MGVKELTDLAIDPATGDYVYTSLKISHTSGMAIPTGYTKPWKQKKGSKFRQKIKPWRRLRSRTISGSIRNWRA